MENAKKLLIAIVTSLVSNKDAVRVENKTDEMGVLLTLHIAPEDMGTVIGQGGNTAKSIRTLLRICGIKDNARINLKIQEPEGSTFRRREDRQNVPARPGELEQSDKNIMGE